MNEDSTGLGRTARRLMAAAGSAAILAGAAAEQVGAQADPYASAASHPLAVQLLGEWRSLDDPNSTMIFAAGPHWFEQAEGYDGATVPGGINRVAFPLACDGATASLAAPLMRVGEEDSGLCYAVDRVTGDTLELTYLARGSTLRFERVPAAAEVPGPEDGRAYRLRNRGFDRLGQEMCVDIFNGGPQDNQLNSQACANYSGQIWYFSWWPSELRHLATYSLTTEFRGPDMCLTMDGSLIDHVLKLVPCGAPPAPNQLWAVSPWKGEGARPDDPLPVIGWTIAPLASEMGEAGAPMYLITSLPPDGDGMPYIDARDFVGDGFIWNLTPN